MGDQQCHIKSYSRNIFILYLWIKLLLFNQANGGGRRHRLWLLSTVIQIRSATRHECNTTLLRNFCPELSWVEFGQHFIITFSIKSLPKWIPGLFKSHSTTLWQFNGITTYLIHCPAEWMTLDKMYRFHLEIIIICHPPRLKLGPPTTTTNNYINSTPPIATTYRETRRVFSFPPSN